MRILVIGAGDYQAPAIKRLRELGHEAFCVDYKAGQPGSNYADGFRIIDVRDKDACLEYAKELGIDGVLTWGATLTLPTVSYIAEKMGLPGLPMETSLLSMNKWAIREKLSNSGLNSAGESKVFRSIEETRDYSFPFPFVVKPCDGSGSKGVNVVFEPEQASAALVNALECARNGEVYVEPFIPGKEFSAECYACNGQVYVYSIVKTDFYWKEEYPVYCQTTYKDITDDERIAVEEEAIKAVKALGVSFGPVNFDIIVSSADQKPYIIDVGIRNGQNLLASHIIPYSRGVDELDQSINLCLGKSVNPSPVRLKFISSRLLIYPPGIISDILPMDDLIGRDHIIDIILRKKKGDRLNRYHVKSDICGWVLVEGDSPEDAFKWASKAWETLKNYIIIDSEL